VRAHLKQFIALFLDDRVVRGSFPIKKGAASNK